MSLKYLSTWISGIDTIIMVKINVPLLTPVTGRLIYGILVNRGLGPFERLFWILCIFKYMHTLVFWKKNHQNFSQAGSCLCFRESLGNFMGSEVRLKSRNPNNREKWLCLCMEKPVKQQILRGRYKKACHWRNLCRVKKHCDICTPR